MPAHWLLLISTFDLRFATCFALVCFLTSILASFPSSSLSASKTALELNFSLPFLASSPLSAHSFVIFCAPLTAITFSSSFLSRLFLLLSHLTRSTFASLIFPSLPSLLFSLPTNFSPRRWRSSALTRRLYANWWLWLLLLLLPPWTLFSSLPLFPRSSDLREDRRECKLAVNLRRRQMRPPPPLTSDVSQINYLLWFYFLSFFFMMVSATM